MQAEQLLTGTIRRLTDAHRSAHKRHHHLRTRPRAMGDFAQSTRFLWVKKADCGGLSVVIKKISDVLLLIRHKYYNPSSVFL